MITLNNVSMKFNLGVEKDNSIKHLDKEYIEFIKHI